MSTYMPKAGDITRNWYVLDAAGKPMGRVAAQAAILLRGKHKPTFTRNLKEVKYSTLMKTRSDFAMQLAVKGMIPDTVIGRNALTRLRVYKGADHKHVAQKPQEWAF